MRCYGGHNHESAIIVACWRCGQDTVQLTNKNGKKYFAQIWERVPESGRAYDTFTCWGDFHRCDESDVAFMEERKAALAEQLADGALVKGQNVVVVSKRSKVAYGTVGVIKWVGEDGYGNTKVGLAVEGFDKLQYIGQSCVTAVPNGADALAVADGYVAEQKALRKAANAKYAEEYDAARAYIKKENERMAALVANLNSNSEL